MSAALAPPRLSSRKGSSGSFIFSEPLDSSKFSNKSSVSASGYSQRGDSGAPGDSGSITPTTESFRGPNLTPRARVSAYVHPRSPVLAADQTALAKTKGRVYDVNGRDAKHVTWRPPAAPSNDTRSGTGYTFGTITAPVSLAKQVAKSTSNENDDAPDVGFVSENVPQHLTQLPASIPKVTGLPEPVSVQERVLRELSSNALAKQPELKPDIDQSVTQSPIIDQIIHKRDPSSSNVATAGLSFNTQGVDDPIVVSASELVAPDESHTPAVLAPAACIIQDKKSKAIRNGEVDETQRSPRRNLFNIQPTLRSMLRPSARENGSEQHTTSGKYPDTPPSSWSGIVPPAPTPATRSPLIFAMGLPSPPWSRSNVLPRHVADTNLEAGTSRGFVSALKWVLKKTFGYFWQRRG